MEAAELFEMIDPELWERYKKKSGSDAGCTPLRKIKTSRKEYRIPG